MVLFTYQKKLKNSTKGGEYTKKIPYTPTWIAHSNNINKLRINNKFEINIKVWKNLVEYERNMTCTSLERGAFVIA